MDVVSKKRKRKKSRTYLCNYRQQHVLSNLKIATTWHFR